MAELPRRVGFDGCPIRPSHRERSMREAVRGRPTLVLTSAACSDKCSAADEMGLMNGLHDPVESDRTMIFGPATGVRWEYGLNNDAAVSIRVVDCRIPGVCAGASPAPSPSH